MIKRQKEEEKKEETQSIQPRDITEELRESYLDYAMSVIISRALPDTRDGLKPVQRRILYTMYEDGLHPGAKLRKSATVVGAALGRYHPHGDIAVYDALVRMAQDFSLRYPLIEGQGNMGSVDNDPPAAARYTEARLSKIAEELLTDIEKETIDWQPNYDGSREEPKVLPGKIPQLILNGAMGIAVGMATNIPPHNLKEVTEAIIYLIDHPQAAAGDLINFVKGPDFPTGGIIYGKEKILEIYANGKGTILCRAKTEIIEEDKKKMILVTEIPYQVNKASLIEKIAQLVEEKRIEGIKDLRDESDKEGLRIAIDLHHGAAPNRIFNQLFKYTELEKSFYINILALTENGLQPQILSLKNLLEEYIKHRKEVIHRRTEFLLRKAEERIHVLEGLAAALQYIDEIIKLIKSSENKEEAREKLMKKYRFTEIQANAILEMKLSNLAKLEKQKIGDELKEKQKLAKEHELILREPKRIMGIIKTELKEIRDKYGDERKTKVETNLPGEVPEEDLIPSKENIITFSQAGYIKRMSPEELKAQKRGGKGVIGYEIKSEDDIITHILSCNSRDKIYFFTNKGHLFEMPAFEIAEGLRTWRGKIIQNYLNLRSEEKIIVFLNLPTDKKNAFKYLIIATEQGTIKKTLLAEYENIRKGGIIAINLPLSDNLVGAALTSGNDEIILASQKGQAIRFSEKELRAMGRNAAGVKGMKLVKDDKVISFITASQQKIKTNPRILVISENGFGKKTELKEYRRQKRGGSGIKTVKITAKTGYLAKILMIEEQEEFIVISQKAQILKAPLAGVPVLRRTTQGVKIMRLENKDKVASITLL